MFKLITKLCLLPKNCELKVIKLFLYFWHKIPLCECKVSMNFKYKMFYITHAISNFFVADIDGMRINLSIQVFCLQILHVESKKNSS